MSDHHRSRQSLPRAAKERTSSKRYRKDESNDAGGGVVGVSSSLSSSFPSINSLPMDILVLIFEYIPQYPRIRVLKFVSKRWHSAGMRSFSSLSTLDFLWNWKFVLPRFPSITSLNVSYVESSNLPDVLPPRLSSLNGRLNRWKRRILRH